MDELKCGTACCQYKSKHAKDSDWLHGRTVLGKYKSSHRFGNWWSTFKKAKKACDASNSCKSIYKKKGKYYALTRDVKMGMTYGTSGDYAWNKLSCSTSNCNQRESDKAGTGRVHGKDFVSMGSTSGIGGGAYMMR